MQFWYNMYGATIGSLSVSVLVQGSSSPTKVWELSGAQGNQWKNAQVNIVSNKAYQVSMQFYYQINWFDSYWNVFHMK